MTIEEMKQARATKSAEVKALLYDGDSPRESVSDEDRQKADALIAEARQLNEQIKQAEADERRLLAVDELTRASNAPGQRQTTPTQPQGGTPSNAEAEFRRIEVSVPHGRLLAFNRGAQDLRTAYACGMWLKERIIPPRVTDDLDRARSEASRWLQDYGQEFRQELERETRTAFTAGDNVYGGATVPTAFSNRLIDLVEAAGIARQYCDVWPMASEVDFVPKKTSSMTAYFTGDQDATTQSRFTLSGVNLTAKELSLLGVVPMSLAQDSAINFADRVALSMSQAAAAKEDDCLFNGTGADTYGGIVGIRTKMIDGNHAASYEDATAGDDQWGEYLIGDILQLTGKTPDYYQTQVERWFISKICWAQTFLRLALAQGGSTAREMTGGLEKQFNGYPAVTTPKMPTSASALDQVVTMLFGDMSLAVTMGVRNQFTVRQSEHRYFEYRQLGILGTERFDIVVHSIGDGSTAGPLVGLRGNTS